MGKFLGWIGAILFLGVLGFGGWMAWPIVIPQAPTGWLSSLSKVDAALLQNRMDLAKKVLEKPDKGLSVSGWLQWEKRVQAVIAKTGNWAWAVKIAQKAQSSFPGNQDLTAYYVWTLLKTNEASEALVFADRVLKGTTWDSLVTQAEVQSQGMASGDWEDLKTVLSQPSEESYRFYSSLAGIDKEPSVRKNALLAALYLGRLEDARANLDVLTAAQRETPPFDQLEGLMAYDQGDWARAAGLLKSLATGRTDNELVLADVYLHLGDREQAKIIYDQLVADKVNPLPIALVVNRATLALDDNDPAKALELLRSVQDRLTETGGDQVRLLLWEARFRMGEVDAVGKALDQVVEERSESDFSLQAELLRSRLFPTWNSIPRLWSLLHRHPAYQPLAERLVWNLISTQDYTGAHRALDLHIKALEKEKVSKVWWISELSAFLLASENRLPESLESFSEIPPAWCDATVYANWSLVSMVQAQQTSVDQRLPLMESALEKITKALDLLAPSSQNEAMKKRSSWLTRRGELEVALIPLENFAQRGTLQSDAAEDFRQAVQLDPDNLRASFLLRQNQAVNEDKS